MDLTKARQRLAKLQRLADNPGTPAEGANARARIADLKAKHPELAKPAPTPRPGRAPGTEGFDDYINEFLRKNRVERERIRKEQEAQRFRDEKHRREQAQQDWVRRHYHTDDMGRPLSEEEKRKAQSDPLGWATGQDRRTTAQRNQDMNNSWGSAHPPRPPYAGQTRTNMNDRQRAQRTTREYAAKAKATQAKINETGCPKPESFYDQGGEPRKRNQHIIDCERCGKRLDPGEGAIFQISGNWLARCCERVPGPRRKKPGMD